MEESIKPNANFLKNFKKRRYCYQPFRNKMGLQINTVGKNVMLLNSIKKVLYSDGRTLNKVC